MQKEYANLRRRTFFTPILMAAALALLVLATGAWWHERQIQSGAATLVMVMRHAEKALDQGDDPPLTAQGLARAERLAAMASDATSYGFDDIYVTQWQRTQATVKPLLAAHGGTVTRVSADQPAAIVESILRRDQGHRVLVVAHSDTVPTIVHGLAPDVTVPMMATMEYGTTYLIAIPSHGRATVLKLTLP